MPNARQARGVTIAPASTTTDAGIVYRSRHGEWRRAEAERAANDQRYRALGFLLPVIELRDEPRNPDGTLPFCASVGSNATRSLCPICRHPMGSAQHFWRCGWRA